jgi:hypothetical protein
VCYQGEKKHFDFRSLDDVVLAAGVELLTTDDQPAERSPEPITSQPGLVEVEWHAASDAHLDVAASWE